MRLSTFYLEKCADQGGAPGTTGTEFEKGNLQAAHVYKKGTGYWVQGYEEHPR